MGKIKNGEINIYRRKKKVASGDLFLFEYRRS